jgi:hypothetical protein
MLPRIYIKGINIARYIRRVGMMRVSPGADSELGHSPIPLKSIRRHGP